MRAANTLRSGFRHPEMVYLALADQSLKGPGDIFDRHVGIDAVLVEEINCVGSQSLQCRIRVLANAFGPAVESFGRSAFLESEFRGDDDILAKRLDRLPYQFLIYIWPVSLGRIEECHAAFIGCADQLNRFVLFCGRAVAKAKPHATQSESRDFQSAAS